MQRIEEPDSLQLEFGKAFPSVILASSSPNRKLLLEKGGCSVTVFTPNADETKIGMTPEEIVTGIASRKIDAYISSKAFTPSTPAIAADTLVLVNGHLLGKPRDREDAGKMLSELSGIEQVVISASGLYIPGKGKIMVTDSASVFFRKLTDKEIESYLSTGEWQGAAGAYRLQKTGYTLVDRIEGDWTTVVGLPLSRILEVTANIYTDISWAKMQSEQYRQKQGEN